MSSYCYHNRLDSYGKVWLIHFAQGRSGQRSTPLLPSGQRPAASFQNQPTASDLILRNIDTEYHQLHMIETLYQQGTNAGPGRSLPPAVPKPGMPWSGPVRAQTRGRRTAASTAPFRLEDGHGPVPQRRKGRRRRDPARNHADRIGPSLAGPSGHHSVTDIDRKGMGSASIQKAVQKAAGTHYRNSPGLDAALSPAQGVPAVPGLFRRRTGRALGATPRPKEPLNNWTQ